jgi:hypothetical protein
VNRSTDRSRVGPFAHLPDSIEAREQQLYLLSMLCEMCAAVACDLEELARSVCGSFLDKSAVGER